METSHYKPRVVLITGVAGFIGSNFATYMVNKYQDISFIGIDKMSYCSNINSIAEIMDKSNFKFIKVDITNMSDMMTIFESQSIDTIIHFAAYTHVDHSFGNSIIYTQNNVVGTHVLLELAKKSDVKRFIHVSTDEVYGCKDHVSHENSILDPTNPYAATKAAAEQIVKSYYHSFRLPIIITRGNNVYGPKQYPEKVIPRFCHNLFRGHKCHIQGTGTQTRSFLYISDVVEAFEIILFKGQTGEIYNIGSDREYSVLEVADRLIALLYPEVETHTLIEFVKDREFNDQRYLITNEKICALGWKQKTTFNDGLKLTLDWYLQHKDFWDKLNISHDDI